MEKLLCPMCETGRKTYLLDKKSPECPYMVAFNEKGCAFFQKIEKKKSGD